VKKQVLNQNLCSDGKQNDSACYFSGFSEFVSPVFTYIQSGH